MDEVGATADTLAVSSLPMSVPRSNGATTFARTTVLPRREAEGGVPVEGSPRYEPVRALGEGGMGEVVLVHDHDIGRKVAVKRLKADACDEGSVLRFAEEVRTIGHLEHPGIVPVHDVGIDEQGQHYLVMKYVEGDTLDTIIEKLHQRDPVYLARYTHSVRAQIFRSMLQALRYAHEKGIIHRDLKPSNVMVGPYGEVMLMDWGIAKKIERGVVDSAESQLADTLGRQVGPQRLVQTAVGALLGTPLYMSPEQAMGRVHELDERSDIYSACLVFIELMTLRHPYADKKSVPELIVAQVKEEITPAQLRELFFVDGTPIEFLHYVRAGLAKNKDDRFPSVAAMEVELQRIANGKQAIKCHVSFAKRSGQEILHWIDRHPQVYSLMFLATAVMLFAGVVFGVVSLVRALL